MINMDVSAAPLPSNFRGTPQQLINAFLDRLSITSDAVTVTISDTEPTDNSPWFRGTQLWVWDTDTSEYVPLDLSASTEDEIFIGASEPDPEEYSLWLKTLGDAIVGLYTYMGTDTGWVTQVVTAVIEDESITTAKIGPSAVTTAKIANLAVTAAKLASGIPLTKLELGAARAKLRMNAGGSAPIWESETVVAERAVTLNSVDEFEHGFDGSPRIVEAVLICDDAAGDDGFEENDEIPFTSFYSDGGAPHTIYKNATYIGIVFGVELHAHRKDTGNPTTLTASKWKVRLILEPGGVEISA